MQTLEDYLTPRNITDRNDEDFCDAGHNQGFLSSNTTVAGIVGGIFTAIAAFAFYKATR